ncbi:MAG: hypothetical protein FWC71_03540 [Defluviitaleaceae bacterium]|nr:hypothetical protein [Defluviitaleaceae bacterium]
MIDLLLPFFTTVMSSLPYQIAAITSAAKTAVGVVSSVRDYFMLEKLENYFVEFQYGTINDGDLQRFHERLSHLEKTPDDLYRLIIIVMDRLDRIYKARYLAKLTKALRSGKISYVQFDDMIKIVENWFESDTEMLKFYTDFYDKKAKIYEKVYAIEHVRRERLISQGMFTPVIAEWKANSPNNSLQPSTYARIMLELISVQDLSTNFSTHHTGAITSSHKLLKSRPNSSDT